MDAETRHLLLKAAMLLDRVGAFARSAPFREASGVWHECGDARLTYANVREAEALAKVITEHVSSRIPLGTVPDEARTDKTSQENDV